MIRIFFLYSFIGMLLLATMSIAAELDSPTVEISGFADVLWMINDGPDEGEDFSLGQAEIDLAASLNDKVNLEMAVAYDADAGSFGLGALVMDLSLLESEEIEKAGILIGQMDVPFGIDWMFYPSLDRHLISGPLAVSSTHDGWNDLGAAVYLETSLLNTIIYRFNGSGYESPYAPEDALEQGVSSAWGCRIGTSALPFVDIGTSYASLDNTEGNQTSRLWGIDAQWTHGDFSAKGEYILQKVGMDAALELEHNGSYIEGMYHQGTYFLLARYGLFSPGCSALADMSQVCLGAGYVVQEGAEFRLERQVGIDEIPDRTTAQFVVGF